MGVGAQIACVPRRFASRGGCSHRQGWGPSALCWGLSALSYRRPCPGEALLRCPTDACVPVGPLGVVPCGPPRGHCFPCASGLTGARLGAQRGSRVETVVGGTWKPNGNRVET